MAVAISNELLTKVKTAVGLSSDDENLEDELTDLIRTCLLDLIPANVAQENIDPDDDLIQMAVKTYCRMNFHNPDPAEYDRLKIAYDELKKQLGMDSRYTVYGQN